MSKVTPISPSKPKLILDWDVETVAAGFADPNWVPQKITAIAWSWVGDDKVHCTTRKGLLGPRDKERARRMIAPFLEALKDADMVTGHNLLRFDIPVLQSELLRNGFSSLKPMLVQDTMRIVKTKGFKKGQENLGHLLRLPIDKLPLSWQQWQDAYDESGWGTVVERCKSDVIQHKLMREEMLSKGWLKPPTWWKP